MRQWSTTVRFEAWDEEDAARIVQRIMGVLDEEQRGLFATSAVESSEYVDASVPVQADPREHLEL